MSWSLCLAGSCGSCPWLVLVGSGYLHALNLVSLVRVVRVPGWCGYLHALNLVPLLAGVLGWKWLPACLDPRACWLVCLVGVVTCIP